MAKAGDLRGRRGRGNYLAFFTSYEHLEQAAGRISSSMPSDRGALFLIDDRFARPQIKRSVAELVASRAAQCQVCGGESVLVRIQHQQRVGQAAFVVFGRRSAIRALTTAVRPVFLFTDPMVTSSARSWTCPASGPHRRGMAARGVATTTFEPGFEW